jgi:enoyl-CoA hydratase
VLDGGRDYLDAFLPAISRALRTLFAFPRPVVAALNGHAIAGGCILACACDLRLMAHGGEARGKIGVPELRVGVPFPAVALEILRFAVPRQYLQKLTYTGHTFAAEDALDRGLVDELVTPERLHERALELARTLADVPAGTFQLSKRQLRQPTLERLREVEGTIDPAVHELWSRPAIHDHIREYLDRTLGKR